MRQMSTSLEYQPTFSPFPEAGLRFLRNLKRNNNRNWFLAHKTEYEESVKKPIEELVRDLTPEFPESAPEAQASPSGCIVSRETQDFRQIRLVARTHVAAGAPWAGFGNQESSGIPAALTYVGRDSSSSS
jgi:uncharacterized protein DUF2461